MRWPARGFCEIELSNEVSNLLQMNISPRPVVRILLRSVPSTNKQRLSDQLNFHMQTKQTFYTFSCKILLIFHTNTVKCLFIILNRNLDFLNKFMDIFGCTNLISKLQARI